MIFLFDSSLIVLTGKGIIKVIKEETKILKIDPTIIQINNTIINTRTKTIKVKEILTTSRKRIDLRLKPSMIDQTLTINPNKTLKGIKVTMKNLSNRKITSIFPFNDML